MRPPIPQRSCKNVTLTVFFLGIYFILALVYCVPLIVNRDLITNSHFLYVVQYMHGGDIQEKITGEEHPIFLGVFTCLVYCIYYYMVCIKHKDYKLILAILDGVFIPLLMCFIVDVVDILAYSLVGHAIIFQLLVYFHSTPTSAAINRENETLYVITCIPLFLYGIILIKVWITNMFWLDIGLNIVSYTGVLTMDLVLLKGIFFKSIVVFDNVKEVVCHYARIVLLICVLVRAFNK
jgi:hypothetical protein